MAGEEIVVRSRRRGWLRRSARARLGVVTAVATMGLVGCGTSDDPPPEVREATTTTADAAPTVMVVGDSVTRLSAEEIRAEMTWAQSIDIHAENGLRTDQLLPLAVEGAAAEPTIGVFMPGYNDILQGTADTDALEAMVAVAAGLDCSVWMLIPRHGAYSTRQVDLWNGRVRRLTESHGNIVLSADWRRLVDLSPDFTYLSHADAVHPSQKGQIAIAHAMSDAAQAACT